MLAMIKEQQAAKNMKKKSAPKRSLSEKIKVNFDTFTIIQNFCQWSIGNFGGFATLA